VVSARQLVPSCLVSLPPFQSINRSINHPTRPPSCFLEHTPEIFLVFTLPSNSEEAPTFFFTQTLQKPHRPLKPAVGTAGARGEGQTNLPTRADAQQLVTTRLLDCLHDPVGRPSRLQGIHPGAR
jgi:hypothetical protein